MCKLASDSYAGMGQISGAIVPEQISLGTGVMNISVFAGTRVLQGLLSVSLLFGVMTAASAPALAQQSASGDNQTIGQYARHFRMYQRDVDDLIGLSFTDIDEVRNAHDLALSYSPRDLSRGWIAHQAIVASRAPGFMETVRSAAHARGRSAFFSQARTSPEYMWTLSSDTAAINFVFDGLYQDSTEAEAVGQILRDRALTYMDRSYGSRLPSGSAHSATEILAASRVGPASRGRLYDVPYRAQGMMQQVLELAARLALDRTDGRSQQAASYLIDHEESNRCVRWAQLNLAQCMAASRNQAEEAYCTGRHGVVEISECWGWMVSLEGGSDHASLGGRR